jgi:hypothetical protein
VYASGPVTAHSGGVTFFRFLVDRLGALRALRPGLTERRAFDIVSVINSLHNYVELTSRHGWTTPQWQEWTAQVLTEQLLGGRDAAT